MLRQKHEPLVARAGKNKDQLNRLWQRAVLTHKAMPGPAFRSQSGSVQRGPRTRRGGPATCTAHRSLLTTTMTPVIFSCAIKQGSCRQPIKALSLISALLLEAYITRPSRLLRDDSVGLETPLAQRRREPPAETLCCTEFKSRRLINPRKEARLQPGPRE